MKRIFVYGTLMQGMDNYHLIQPFVSKIMTAVISGAEIYHLEYGYPALTFSGKQTQVHGEIMELADMAQALLVLDHLEEYHGVGCQDNLYDRIVWPAVTPSGASVDAYVYVWSRPAQLTELGQLVKGGCWRTYRLANLKQKINSNIT